MAWGREALRLQDAAADNIGSGRVAEALSAVRRHIEPPTRDYVDQTGFCLAEVSVAVHAMADAYQRTEDHNVDQSEQLVDTLLSLGVA